MKYYWLLVAAFEFSLAAHKFNGGWSAPFFIAVGVVTFGLFVNEVAGGLGKA